ncbi:uncharacterized protein BX663DRAFT_267209 [Cokeromyces recurvatus]|uniref:uncharacterized protein n=1 Tax=Cokeromyces recurvatus TaxID=90255 RepID=UPI00221ED06C|nr:uncharacterized protein BX663DRAFT_267209 [Cokeromyces recurvatus]KAI7898266.1 hypothetical protein BX663DRAFT_267209 [Cokeromyces recurvatus]
MQLKKFLIKLKDLFIHSILEMNEVNQAANTLTLKLKDTPADVQLDLVHDEEQTVITTFISDKSQIELNKNSDDQEKDQLIQVNDNHRLVCSQQLDCYHADQPLEKDDPSAQSFEKESTLPENTQSDEIVIEEFGSSAEITQMTAANEENRSDNQEVEEIPIITSKRLASSIDPYAGYSLANRKRRKKNRNNKKNKKIIIKLRNTMV